jgi:hypothetical protein
MKAKAFAVPNVKAGSVIEYQYKEVRDNELSNYMLLPFAQNYPIHLVKYHVKPLQLPQLPFRMRAFRYGTPNTPFEEERDGFSAVSLTNVPAVADEPEMPPENAIRPWMLIYYSGNDKKSEEFWKETGKNLHKDLKDGAKVNDEMKKAAAEAITSASTDEEKLARLLRLVRTRVKNVFDESSGVTAAQREKYKANRNAGEAWKQGLGTGGDRNNVFAAMAMSLGYDVRAAWICDRSRNQFTAAFPDTYFLDSRSLAVKVGTEWKFFDAGGSHLPPGMLRWAEEGAAYLQSDPKEGVLGITPMSPPERSVRRKVARLTLAEDGSMEGELELSYTGHAGIDVKNLYEDLTPEKRLERVKELYTGTFPEAQVNEIKIDEFTDPEKPFRYTCRIKVPGYAQRTGRRLLFQPAFFQVGRKPRFPESNRRYDVFFDYPWHEQDEVTIEMPLGWQLDHPEAPPGAPLGKTGEYKVNLTLAAGGTKLVYKRDFIFGRESILSFPQKSYPAIKKAFDFIHEQDNHMLSLRRE